MASLDVAISIRVKDHDRIRASLQTLDVDKDYFPSLPDGKIDSSETVMSQNEVLSLDEMKDSLRTSENDYEALATDDCIEAELEKLINMTPEEADAEARGKSSVALREARDATCKAQKAVRHFQAIMEALEKYPRTELAKMWSHHTLKEAAEKAIEKSDAAMRELRAAKRKVDKSVRLVEATSKARGKRPSTVLSFLSGFLLHPTGIST